MDNKSATLIIKGVKAPIRRKLPAGFVYSAQKGRSRFVNLFSSRHLAFLEDCYKMNMSVYLFTRGSAVPPEESQNR